VISLEKINKNFNGEKVLEDVSLKINEGEVFGVVGLSGAGKSTLVRCINLLERPDSGRIFVDGREMTAMNDRELRRARQNIGMISQNFNLFKRYSVWENVAFPLRLIRMPRAEVKDRVARLLELVGLADKAAAYPRQLSGGQQQRVAIARALANKPRVLLCDEPTSALDPVTAQSFLELLSAINRQLGLTIVLITHQMGVIRAVCQHVAVVHEGKIVELGPVDTVSVRPESEIARHLLHSEIPDIPQGCWRLSFIGETVRQPVLARLIKEMGAEINILAGNIDSGRLNPYGWLLVSVEGNEDQKVRARRALEDSGVSVEVMGLGD